ncbi:asparagine synthase (glutamine-hydrolyzing) [Bacteriovoracales bacterium]|nr:asparagine synthase (glutamine-hydrolyzing) [Bacteriovoracales bacterium]
MCGIFGYLDKNKNKISENILFKMQNAINHRGPDQNGITIRDNIGIGSVRLSIIDLAKGKMPISSLCGRFSIVHNGEIYNHLSLRKELKNESLFFQTDSDSETVLKVYEEKRDESFKKLNGMFAFSIIDRKTNELTLCRDQLGQKPLYYYEDSNLFIFSSEIKAILQHPSVKRQVCPEGLDFYLTLGYCPSPHTMFKGIKKLPPGHYLKVKNNKVSIHQYWKLESYKNKNDFSAEEEIKKLREKLIHSVESRLMSDVDMCIFLSGGVDSTVIAGIVTKILGKKLNTYSLGFSSKSGGGAKKFNNDVLHAGKVAQFLQTNHNEIFVEYNNELPDILTKVISQMDEPCYAPTLIPLYAISKEVSKHYKVALTGDGGDELFGGYQMYYLEKLISPYNHLPKVLKNVVNSVSGFKFAPKKLKSLSLRGNIESSVERYLTWKGIFSGHNINIFSPKTAISNLKENYESGALKEYSEDFMSKDISLWISDHTTNCFDKMSMLNSLETRSSYLDHDLVQYSQKIPLKYKIKNKSTKWILKEAFKDIIPQNVLTRQTGSMLSPSSQWLRTSLRPLVDKYLSEAYIKKAGLVNPELCIPLIKNHLNASSYAMVEVWSLLTLHMWYDIFIDN